MRLSAAIAASLLAIIPAVVAVPAAPTSKTSTDKPFKLAITTDHGKGTTVYLIPSTFKDKYEDKNIPATSTDASKAVLCTLQSGSIACGPQKKGLSFGAMHTVESLRMSDSKTSGFSVDSNGIITWKPSKYVINFSTHGASSTVVYAEICNGAKHGDAEGPLGGFVPGVAKAIYE